MTEEGKIKAVVSKTLSQAKHVWYFMPVQNGMGKATLDYIGAQQGRAFAIETKAPGKAPTPRQENTIREMRAAGVAVFIVDGTERYPIDPLLRWLGFTPEVKDAVNVFELTYRVK